MTASLTEAVLGMRLLGLSMDLIAECLDVPLLDVRAECDRCRKLARGLLRPLGGQL